MKNSKKAFTIIELLFTIIILSIFSGLIYSNLKISKLNLAANRIVLYLNYTKYLASLENHYNNDEAKWFKKLWTLKFQRCRSSVGGLYFIVYSDKDMDGYIDKVETAKDPLTQRYLYSSNYCNENSSINNKYVLLTKQYKIEEVTVSCNNTSSIGQISFDQYGRVYSKLTQNEYTNEVVNECVIKLKDINNDEISIIISPKTGFIIKK
jgi:prepilin-type N-terminal cleavage/methylation domain-containing protein